MPKRTRKTRLPDPNELAFSVTQVISGEVVPKPEVKKNPHAVALGRIGGAKGGKARAAKMTKTQRTENAKKAAKARWG
jgi:hypothetical protein